MTPIFIRAIRKRDGLTQQALGQLLRVNKLTVGRWENGEIACTGPAAVLLEHFLIYGIPDPNLITLTIRINEQSFLVSHDNKIKEFKDQIGVIDFIKGVIPYAAL